MNIRPLVAAAAWFALYSGPASGQTIGAAQRIDGIANSIAIATAPDDPNRLFVLDLAGRIRIVKPGATGPHAVFLDLPASGISIGGNGATGLAFDPRFQTNRHFYVCYSTASAIWVVRYTVSPDNPNLALPASRHVVLTRPGVAQHTGGWIGFGRDDYLYVSGGDQWTPGSPQGIDDWCGKILRIDPSGDDFPGDANRNYAIPLSNPFAGNKPGLDEVWALGIRNAFRCSFDRLTGDFWIADVGQSQREEVNFEPRGFAGGANYGWPCFEGEVRLQSTGVCKNPRRLAPPVIDLTRSQTGCIIGGYVYRGCAMETMRGRYIFGSCTGPSGLYSFDPANPRATLVLHSSLVVGQLYGMGEDAFGELYLCSSQGLFRLIPAAGTYFDCNRNNRPDSCDIAEGTARDTNGDGLPDSCTRRCPADFDASGAVAVGDIFWFLQRWFESAPDADFNGAGGVTLDDLFDFLRAYFVGCA